MNIAAILNQAETLGVTLTPSGNRLRYAPRSRTPREFVNTLRRYKQDLLNYLANEPPYPCTPESQSLLAWASELAEGEVELEKAVSYVEVPMVPVTTKRISHYARRYLGTIAYSRLQQKRGSWQPWTSGWWMERENVAMGALTALKAALDGQGQGI